MNHSHPVIRQHETPKREHHIVVEENFGTDSTLEPIAEFSSDTIRVDGVNVFTAPVFFIDDITAVVVNYQTRQLIETAVTSFREFYPNVKLVIVDNGSTDNSWEWIRDQEDDVTEVIRNETNQGHGPALDKEFIRATTPFVFTFDSDVTFVRAGLLENLLTHIKDTYAIGWLRWVNISGVAVNEKKPFNKDRFCPYIHPCAALYNRDTYLSLSPFVNKGAPAVVNMRDAQKRGIKVRSYPIENYVEHLVAGTRRMWNGRWNPGDSAKNEWDRRKTFPI